MLITIHTPDGQQTIDTYTLTEAERIALGVNLQHHINDVHKQALNAWRNWRSLTLAQKDTIVKNLLWHALYQEGLLEQTDV